MSEERAGWAELVRRHGGLAASSLSETPPAEVETAALLGVVAANAPHLPALARLTPAQAVALLVIAERENGGAVNAASANELLATLTHTRRPSFLLNDGPVGGDPHQPGSIRLNRREANELLGAAMSDQLGWEVDPDFGYELPLASPSLDADRARALAPRLAYTASGRVYDYAQLVPALKEERHSVLGAIAGLDPAIVAASGWPVEPTGSSWRDLRRRQP